MPKTRLCILIGALLAAVRVGVAATTAPTPPEERQSLEAFAASHAACRSWSDGCMVCARQSGGTFACATPGPACQPGPLACRDPEAPAPHTP